MIIRIIFIGIILMAILWLMRSIKRLEPKQQKKAYITIGVWAFVIILVLGVITGKMHWLGMVAAFAIGAAKIGLRFLPVLKFLGNRASFANPVFNTENITCEINLKTGQMSGKINTGHYANKDLNALSVDDINTLRNTYKDTDKRAYYLLFVLLQQKGNTQSTHNQSTHNQNNNQQTNFNDVGDPSYQEAIQILGLSESFSKQDIIDAHRQLIQKFHPDRGGNDYLASRINQAKSILIAQYKNK